MSAPETIEQLCTQWLEAKAAERKATDMRVAIEEQIIAVTGKRDEGAKTVDANGFKITVTGKITRKMDWAAWETAKLGIPNEMHPVRYKPELDERGVKWLAEHKPDYYKMLPIESKPAKTSVDIKPVETAAS